MLGVENPRSYLYTGVPFWTMSPLAFDNYAFVLAVGEHGSLLPVRTTEMLFIRPVISLKSDVSLSGSGTMDDPFVLS